MLSQRDFIPGDLAGDDGGDSGAEGQREKVRGASKSRCCRDTVKGMGSDY